MKCGVFRKRMGHVRWQEAVWRQVTASGVKRLLLVPATNLLGQVLIAYVTLNTRCKVACHFLYSNSSYIFFFSYCTVSFLGSYSFLSFIPISLYSYFYTISLIPVCFLSPSFCSSFSFLSFSFFLSLFSFFSLSSF